jgi:hypothetical protein
VGIGYGCARVDLRHVAWRPGIDQVRNEDVWCEGDEIEDLVVRVGIASCGDAEVRRVILPRQTAFIFVSTSWRRIVGRTGYRPRGKP